MKVSENIFIAEPKWFSDFYQRPHLNPLLEKRRGQDCEIRKPLYVEYKNGLVCKPKNTQFILWILLFVFSTFFAASRTNSQTLIDSSLAGKMITSIQIQGNDKTHPSVILREMKLKEGDPLDLEQLEKDRKHIQNLNLFNRVLMVTEQEKDNVLLKIVVTEQWYVFPFPIVFVNERDWKKISYGLGLSHLNFRGRAETLVFSFWLGYNPSVHLDYTNPWMGGTRNLFTQVAFFYNQIRSKHYTDERITENHLGFQWELGKRFGYTTFLSFNLGYKEVQFAPAVPGQTLSPKGKDRIPHLGILLTWDCRDLKEYPHTGWYLHFSLQKSGFPSLMADYLKYRFELRTYVPLGLQRTLALRTKAELSSGQIPLYDRLYLGYSERIRGHFFDTSEGENMVLASMALRIPIVPIRYFHLPDRPELNNLKFGISLGFFADTGLTWFQNEHVRASMLQSGYGFGIHFHLPYIHVLRLEMAFDEKGNEQFIADLHVDI